MAKIVESERLDLRSIAFLPKRMLILLMCKARSGHSNLKTSYSKTDKAFLV